MRDYGNIAELRRQDNKFDLNLPKPIESRKNSYCDYLLVYGLKIKTNICHYSCFVGKY